MKTQTQAEIDRLHAAIARARSMLQMNDEELTDLLSASAYLFGEKTPEQFRKTLQERIAEHAQWIAEHS